MTDNRAPATDEQIAELDGMLADYHAGIADEAMAIAVIDDNFSGPLVSIRARLDEAAAESARRKTAYAEAMANGDGLAGRLVAQSAEIARLRAEIERKDAALRLAEDVLSRAPLSTQIWPNGMHPNDGITIIRDALVTAGKQS